MPGITDRIRGRLGSGPAISGGYLSGGGITSRIRSSLAPQSSRQPQTIEELRETVSLLEQAQNASGARAIEQDSPGAFRRIVDVLSRPNYAIAGFFEEVLGNDRSVENGVKRALTEIFSGVGSVQGEKRAFGEVLENLGVGTITLADAFPALEGTWVGEFGTRGAAGLALDIFTDPLTYIGGGKAATSLVKTLNVGGKPTRVILNAKGVARRNELAARFLGGSDNFGVRQARLARKLSPNVKGLGKNATELERASFAVANQRARLVLERSVDDTLSRLPVSKGGIIDDATGEVAKEFVDDAAVSFINPFDNTPVKTVLTKGRVRQFYEPMRIAIEQVPGAAKTAEVAGKFGDAMRAGINRLFHPGNALGNLPKALRGPAMQLHRDFMNASYAHRQRLLSIAEPLAKIGRQLEKTDPELAKKFISIREGKPVLEVVESEGKYSLKEGKQFTRADLTEEQAQLYDQFFEVYDSMGKTLVDAGVLEPEDILNGYMFHKYENMDDLREIVFDGGRPGGGITRESFTKERAFDSFHDSIRISFDKAEMGRRAGNADAYRVLKPDYDIFKSMETYIHMHAEALARKAWHEEVLARFGKVADDFDITALYKLHTSLIEEGSPAAEKIAKFFQVKSGMGAKAFRELWEQEDTFVRAGGRNQIGDAASAQANDIRKGILALSRQTVPRSKQGLTPARMKGEAHLTGFKKSHRKVGEMLADKIRAGHELSPAEYLKAREIVESNKRQVESLLGREVNLALESGGKNARRIRTDATARVMKNAKTLLRELDDTGQREFIRQLLLRAKSSDQVAEIERALWDEFSTKFPVATVRDATKLGEVDATMAKRLGEKAAQMVEMKNKFTGGVSVRLPRAIAEDLVTVNSQLLNTREFKEVGKMLRGFDWLNNKFKLGVYTLWPASMVRDGYSNVALSMLDIGIQALNPTHHRDSVKLLAASLSPKRMAEYGDEIVEGTGKTFREVIEEAKDLGVYVPGEVFAEIAGDPRTAGKLLRKASGYRGQIENEARLTLWLANRRRGLDAQAAADHVAEFLFNYGELSTVEREVFRRMIPFYTFTRKNVELQAKMLVKNPGMEINQLKPFRGRHSENEQMTTFEGEALKIRLDGDGKTVHVLTGIDLPLRNLDTIWAGGFGETGRRALGMLTPFIKAPLETVVDRDLFTGGNLKRVRADTLGRVLDHLNTPDGLKNFFGYKKEFDQAGRPRYTADAGRVNVFLRSWMFSRAFSTSDRVFREYTDHLGVDTKRAMMDLMTGVRAKELNMEEQQKRRLNDRIRQLQDSLVRRGVQAEFTRSFTPREQGQLR